MSRVVTSYAAVALDALLDHLDALKALHRASESPTFGQVEKLFDLAAAVRQSALVPPPRDRAAWPSAGTATEKAARRLVELVLASVTDSGAGR
jgi:hypothetical protein